MEKTKSKKVENINKQERMNGTEKKMYLYMVKRSIIISNTIIVENFSRNIL